MIVKLWLVANANLTVPRAIVQAHYATAARVAVNAPKSWRAVQIGLAETDDRGAAAPEYRQVVREFKPVRAPGGINAPPRRAPRDAQHESAPGRALAAASAVYNIHPTEGRYRRTREAAQAKSATWYALIIHGGWSAAGAGRGLGHHHSTVLASLKRASKAIAAGDRVFLRAIEAAASQVGAASPPAPPAPTC